MHNISHMHVQLYMYVYCSVLLLRITFRIQANSAQETNAQISTLEDKISTLLSQKVCNCYVVYAKSTCIVHVHEPYLISSLMCTCVYSYRHHWSLS